MVRQGFSAVLLLGLIIFISGLVVPPVRGQESMADLPGAARAILAKAGQLMNDKEYDKAVQIIVEFQATAPPVGERKGDKGWFHAEMHHALGVCYLLQERFAEAAKPLQLAVAKDPHHQPALLNLAKAAYELGDHRLAAASFLAAYQVGSDKNSDHLYFAAIAHLLGKEYGNAVTLLERLLNEHQAKAQPEWRENLVHALQSAGENRRALPHLKILSASTQGDKQRQWQELLLHQYLQLGMSDEALFYAEELSATAPGEVKWWRALTHIHLQHNRYREALTCLLVTGYLGKPSAEELRLTADLYLQLGVPRQAVVLYEDMIREVNTPQLLANLLIALQQLGHHQQALQMLEQFAPPRPSPELALHKADLLFTLGRYQDAATLYRKIAATASGKQRDRALRMAEYAITQRGETTRDTGCNTAGTVARRPSAPRKRRTAKHSSNNEPL